jgi:hypothetical protein
MNDEKAKQAIQMIFRGDLGGLKATVDWLRRCGRGLRPQTTFARCVVARDRAWNALAGAAHFRPIAGLLKL